MMGGLWMMDDEGMGCGEEEENGWMDVVAND
jgi:hypothetical protein